MGRDTFHTVAIDPPWNETGGGKVKRGADRHYPLIRKVSDIYDTIVACPYWSLVHEDAHCWLWTTNNFLPRGLWLLEQLGFRYITNCAWAKMQPIDEESALYQPQRFGLGQYLRGGHELLLLGVRGKTMKPTSPRVSTLLPAPRRKHSEKPTKAYDNIEAVSPGPYLELFARRERPGWTCWGDEKPNRMTLAEAP